MRSFNEWKRDKTTKTIIVTCRDQDNTLEDLIKYIKGIGNTGHTFNIVVDDEKTFEWDGDGSDAIFEIKVDKESLKLAFDVEGEPTEIEESVNSSDKQKAMTELATVLRDFFKNHPLAVRKYVWKKMTEGEGKKNLDRLLLHPKEQPLNVFKALMK